MAFLNPLVLLGLAAAAIPIIVHLFNFRRPERVDFPTLRFLREVEATAMRRVRIRQWLLLALRTLAIIFLVLAFARPTLDTEAAAFEAGAARSLALVVDNSRSMTLRDAQGALLDQARDVGAAVVEATASGDERTVLPTAAPPEYRPVPFTTPGPALDAVAATEAASGAEPLTSAVARAASVLEGAAHPRREVVVVSDLQAATFTDSASARLPDDVDVALLPLGARAQTNTAVTGIEIVSRIVEPGRPVQVEATVVRYGGEAATIGASLLLDGQRVAETAVDLVPGEPVAVPFTVTPPARGWVGGEVRLEADAAEWDDRRFFALRVPPPPRVLVVRGDGARADLVTLALGVAAEEGGLALDEIAEGALGSADLDPVDVVVLVGPARLGADVARLEAFVAQGGGMLAFPGTEAAALNPLLRAAGGGPIDGLLGDGDASLGTTTDADTDHPLFAGVFDASRPTLEQPDIRRIAQYRPRGGDEATLIGTQAGPPLLHEIRRGEGSVLLFGVAPDPTWSDLPQRGLFVPLMYRAAAYLAAGSSVADTGELRVREGGTVRVEGVDAGQPLRLVGPDGSAITPLQRTVPGGVVLDVDDAVAEAGLYRVTQGDRVLRVVAVNEDARESDPAALAPEEAARRLGEATGRPVRVLDAAAAGIGAEERGVALWTVFLALALLCLLAETLLTVRWRAPEAVAA
ncbi:MAG: BatA and WFA domain-containing protein [Bacteroidota bacterium]